MRIVVERFIDVDGLGRRIKKARRADPRSVEVLATAAGISRGWWYKLEQEFEREAVPITTIRRVGKVLGVDLLEGVEDENE
jgi:transcriptional regulator with XRE-family HTH domain